jgi:acetylornithine deacetylase/succinyl-diaminopimelate desuccinylase-like protein
LDWRSAENEAIAHLRALIRINTVNPPGNELEAARYLASVLEREHVPPTVIEFQPGRANVVARLQGIDRDEALLLYGHTDVVPVERGCWTHDPFGGELAEGFIWGRGALDMKAMVVQSLMTMILLKRSGLQLRRDVVFAATGDEEVEGNGIRFLVDRHPKLIRAGWGLSESGAFTQHIHGQRLYPIKTAEKGAVWLQLSFEGKPGHGSVPRADNVVAKMAEAIVRLKSANLGYHITPHAAAYLRSVGKALGGWRALVLARVPSRRLVLQALRGLDDPELRDYLSAIVHDTVTATVVHAGEKTNVIPSGGRLSLDCRTLPGTSSRDLIARVQRALGVRASVAVESDSPPLEVSTDTDLFRLLTTALVEADPEAVVTPYMASGATDAKFTAPLGIRTYGFSPVRLQPGQLYTELVHSHDERIPVEGFLWGLHVLYSAVEKFCRA